MKQKVLVGDLGCDDGTLDCLDDCEIVDCRGLKRDEARNKLIDMTPAEMCFYIDPWEVLVQGHNCLKATPSIYNATIVQNDILTKEARIWHNNRKVRFVNPVFERLNGITYAELPIVLYSSGMNHKGSLMSQIKEWQRAYPTNKQPLYYYACSLLMNQQYEEFLVASEAYMHAETINDSISAIMNRYYYATVQIIYKHKVRAALQNLSICMARRPLMAEFWCLAGDVYYHLIKDFPKAKVYYQNAITLGQFRKSADNWPMEISKYSKYPKAMISSCDELIKGSYFLKSKSQHPND